MKLLATPPSLLILQTSDLKEYFPLLKITSGINKRFAKIRNHYHVSFVGICRGERPWNACYNRIYLLDKLLKSQRYDWILYMDADCAVVDMEWDIREFLKPYSEKGILASQGGTTQPHDINDGVMFLNCRHEGVKVLISEWMKEFETSISDKDLAFEVTEMQNWNSETMPVHDDQYLLQKCLLGMVDRKTMQIPLLHVFRGNDKNLINYDDGVHIKHILRKKSHDISVRMECAREIARKVGESLTWEPVFERMEDVN